MQFIFDLLWAMAFMYCFDLCVSLLLLTVSLQNKQQPAVTSSAAVAMHLYFLFCPDISNGYQIRFSCVLQPFLTEISKFSHFWHLHPESTKTTRTKPRTKNQANHKQKYLFIIASSSFLSIVLHESSVLATPHQTAVCSVDYSSEWRHNYRYAAATGLALLKDTQSNYYLQ